MWTKQYTSGRDAGLIVSVFRNPNGVRSPNGAGSATDLRYRLAEVQSIPTADLAATSSLWGLRPYVCLRSCLWLRNLPLSHSPRPLQSPHSGTCQM